MAAKKITACRDAKTGKFVKESYAKKHQSTTVKETIKKNK